MATRSSIGYIDSTGKTPHAVTTYVHHEGDTDPMLPRLATFGLLYGGYRAGRFLAGSDPIPGTDRHVKGWTFVAPDTPDLSEYSDTDLDRMRENARGFVDDAAFYFSVMTATYGHADDRRTRILPGFGGTLFDMDEDTRTREAISAGPPALTYLFTADGGLDYYHDSDDYDPARPETWTVVCTHYPAQALPLLAAGDFSGAESEAA